MAKQIIDLSGTKGLVERHQGDLNDTSSQPNLRYLAEDGQYADGIFNPFKIYGYMSPAVDSFDSLTGTIEAPINSIQYDPSDDIVYLSEEGENILKLDGLDDTSLSNYLSITAGYDIKDMLIYEMNGQKSLVYVIDANEDVDQTGTSTRVKGLYVGFKTTDTTKGITMIDVDETDDGTGEGSSYHEVSSVANEQGSGNPRSRKLAQQFVTSDFNVGFPSVTNPNNGYTSISGVEMFIDRPGGTGVGITMKVSIQTDATANAGDFTSRGAWSNAVTNYVVDDTVTNGGSTWQCITDHSAAAVANEEPGVGTNWESYWNLFGAPTGTEIASQTFSLEDLEDLDQWDRNSRFNIEFSSIVDLTPNTTYWLVLEESGTNMGGSDLCGWMSTLNDDGSYARHAKNYKTALGRWESLNTNGDILTSAHDNFDFKFILNRQDDWSSSTATGKFSSDETGKSTFLYLADNGLVYWFVGNHVHTLDGSITGGDLGKATEDVLVFPSYIQVADVAETRSRMYIGIQTSDTDGVPTDRTFGSSKIGVYIWDRRSQVQGSTDFYPCPGAREIKSVFVSSTGDVKLITIGNSGASEIRGISGNQYAVLHTFEKDGYPPSRKGVSQVDNVSVWLGANGIYYGYGSVTNNEKPQLYKIGDLSSQINNEAEVGPILVGNQKDSEREISILSAVDGFSGISLTDYYSETNLDSFGVITTGLGSGQTFVSQGGDISSVKFLMTQNGSTGTVEARLYGTSAGAPTGSVLATSSTVNLSTVSAINFELIEFSFPSTYTMTSGVEYFVGVFGTSVTGSPLVGTDSTNPSHSSTRYIYNGSSFTISTRDTIFYVYEDVNGLDKVYKWYPNGYGTINSITQVPNQGDIYTKVYTLPSLSTVKYLRLMMAPGATTGTTVIANVKCYYNQSTTAAWTMSVTLDDIARGWKQKEINKNNVNFIQFEIEYVTDITLGDSDFRPMYIELEYADEGRINP